MQSIVVRELAVNFSRASSSGEFFHSSFVASRRSSLSNFSVAVLVSVTVPCTCTVHETDEASCKESVQLTVRNKSLL